MIDSGEIKEMLEFDKCVNMMIEGKDDAEILDFMIKNRDRNIFALGGVTLICYIAMEFGRYDMVSGLYSKCQYMDGSSLAYLNFYARLYNENTRANIKCSILNCLEVCFEVSDTLIVLLYHLLKNRCYDIIVRELEMAELFIIEQGYFSKLMAVAVKNRDTEGLVLFLKRGYTFEQQEKDVMTAEDVCYINETVLSMTDTGGRFYV